MKNKDEVIALRDKAHEVYEKLAVLAYVDEYIETTPNLSVSKEEILKKIDKTLKIKPVKKVEKPEVKKQQTENQKVAVDIEPEKKEDTVFEPKFESVKIDLQTLKSNQISSKEEFRDAISADKTATLFDDDESVASKKTLNDKLINKTITVGLNDRIAFVNNLFNFNQTEFNRVLSQLNTFNTEKEAKEFLLTVVKPEYDWSDKETYEERLLALIERKFT